MAATLLGLGGVFLTRFEYEDLRTHGIIIIYIAAMLFATLGIYVWMAATLPGSTQEVELNALTVSYIVQG